MPPARSTSTCRLRWLRFPGQGEAAKRCRSGRCFVSCKTSWLLVLALFLAGCSGGAGEYDVSTTVISGEFTQDIWVTAPDPDSDDFGTWPFVLAFHGLGGTGEGLSKTAEELARNGVVVFAPDYRSTELHRVEDDGECAYRYAFSIAEDYGVDIDQPITIMGHSMGAFVGMVGGLDENAYGPGGTYDRCYSAVRMPDVIVPVAGCYYEFEGSTFPFDVSPFSNFGVDIVMISGSDDEVCEPWQSRDATATLAAAGYDATLEELDGGNHANLIFFEDVGDEWVRVEDDPIGSAVVQIILDSIDNARG